MDPSPTIPPSFRDRPRWWRSPFLLLALLGGISLGWLWWESSQQGRGIGWVSSSERRYFVSHGAGWIFLGAVTSNSHTAHHHHRPRIPAKRRFEPWVWDQKMPGEHRGWLPPFDLKITDENELRRLGFCYWFLLSGYLGLCLASSIWWRRRQRLAACPLALADERSE